MWSLSEGEGKPFIKTLPNKCHTGLWSAALSAYLERTDLSGGFPEKAGFGLEGVDRPRREARVSQEGTAQDGVSKERVQRVCVKVSGRLQWRERRVCHVDTE